MRGEDSRGAAPVVATDGNHRQVGRAVVEHEDPVACFRGLRLPSFSDRAARSLSGLPDEPDRGAEDRASAERSPRCRQASTCAGPVFVRRVLSECLMTASATSSPAKATLPYAIVVIQSPRPVRGQKGAFASSKAKSAAAAIGPPIPPRLIQKTASSRSVARPAAPAGKLMKKASTYSPTASSKAIAISRRRRSGTLVAMVPPVVVDTTDARKPRRACRRAGG